MDREGNPAGVCRFNWAPILAPDHQIDVQTSQDGSFSIEHVHPDLAYFAHISYRAGQEVPPLGDKDDITLTLRPNNRFLTGNLVEESGKPVVSLTLYPHCYVNEGWKADTETDDQGFFEYLSAPAGYIFFRFITDEFRPTTVSVLPGQNHVEVVLRDRAELRYRVMNAEMQPMANVNVVIHEYEDHRAEAANAAYPLLSDASGEVVFSIPPDREGCTFRAEFRAEGYPLAFVTTAGRPDLRRAANCSIDVILTEGETWRGRIVDENGAGIAGAEVRVIRCEYRSGIGAHCWLPEDRENLITRTDSDGYWTFPRLSREDYLVFRVRAEGFEEKQEYFSPDLMRPRKTELVPIQK